MGTKWKMLRSWTPLLTTPLKPQKRRPVCDYCLAGKSVHFAKTTCASNRIQVCPSLCALLCFVAESTLAFSLLNEHDAKLSSFPRTRKRVSWSAGHTGPNQCGALVGHLFPT